MYDDLLLRLPESEQDMWGLLKAQFEHMSDDFGRLHFETRDEAFDSRHHKTEHGIQRGGLNVVRYRDVDETLDSRSHFWQMGQSLVPQVERLIAARQLTPVFVQQWGKLTFCHGYIMGYVFDDSDDLGNKRGGTASARARSVDRQRKWLAHHLVPLIDAGLARPQAEARVVEHIGKLIENGSGTRAEHDFLGRIITRGGLAATYDDKHFFVLKMRQLMREPIDDIPAITALTP